MRSLFLSGSTIILLLTLPFAVLAQEPGAPSGPGGEKRDPFAGDQKGKSVDPLADLMPVRRPPQKKNLFVADLFGVFHGHYQIEYQRALTSRLSLVVTPWMRLESEDLADGISYETTILGVNGGVAFYFPQDAMQGPNVALTAGVMQVGTTGIVEDSKVTWNAKGTIGYRYQFDSGLSLALSVGYLHMPEVQFFNMMSGVIVTWNGGPVVEIGLGWAF